MTSCTKVTEEIDEEDGIQENSPREMDKSLATQQSILIRGVHGSVRFGFGFLNRLIGLFGS